jgi:hypothetical protein
MNIKKLNEDLKSTMTESIDSGLETSAEVLSYVLSKDYMVLEVEPGYIQLQTKDRAQFNFMVEVDENLEIRISGVPDVTSEEGEIAHTINIVEEINKAVQYIRNELNV